MRKFPVGIAIILFLSTFSVLEAQLGLKLGVHSFELNNPTDLIFPDNSQVNFSKAELGFQGGIYGKVDIKAFFIETRLILHSTSVEYTLDGENGGLGENIFSESFTNLDVPLLLGLNVAFLDLYAGPVAHIHLNSASDLVDFKDYGERFSRAEYGWRLGVGTQLGKISIGVEYEGNFSKYGDHITIAGQAFNFGDTPNRLIFNIGYELF